jgi:threonine/homoserine/homoserine lactone efflux protein
MENLSALLGVIAALTVGVVSPGPSFVMVARTAVSSSRSDGVAAAVGMGAGAVLFAITALLGLQAFLLAVPSLYVVLKILGGLYLAYLGVRIWRLAKEPLPVVDLMAPRMTKLKALVLGFTTQVSNPKTAIVYASVFATFMPATQSLAFDLVLVSLVFTIEASWYAVVALALSSERSRLAYLRYKCRVDRIAGGVMVALGLKLASSAYRA